MPFISQRAVAHALLAVFLLGNAVWWSIRLIKEGMLDPDVEGRVMVLYSMPDTLFTNRQGIFAEVNAVLGALQYAEQYGAAAVEVHYDSADYVDPARGPNWWAYFFEPVMPVQTLPRASSPPPAKVHFNGIFCRFGRYGSFSQVLYSHEDDKRPFPLEHAGAVTRAQLHALFHRHIRLQPGILEETKQFFAPLPKDTFVIGVHFRGTDKVNNWPHVKPSMATFVDIIRLTMSQYGPRHYKIFVATDEQNFVTLLQSEFGADAVMFQAASPRVDSADAEARALGVHKSKRFDPFTKGKSAILDWLLLGHSHFVIKNRSGLSDMALVFNGAVPFAYILANHLIFSDTLHRADIRPVKEDF